MTGAFEGRAGPASMGDDADGSNSSVSNHATAGDPQKGEDSHADLSPGQVDHLADLVRDAFAPATGGYELSRILEPNDLERRSFGRFERLELIGCGGFGHVYRAFDPRHGRYVALKIPYRRNAIDETMMRRFRLEALAAGKLDHPGVVPIYEVGEVEGRPYIAAAYAPGRNLSEWLRRFARDGRTLPSCAAARISLAVARAMAAAHGLGIIHRDLKPSNVILQPTDGPADVELEGVWHRVRIIDFGLAKFTASSADLTRTDFHIGTPHYMAPEQFTRRFGPISLLTDIYGLGATLYTALAGREPFAGDEQLDLFGRILVDPPGSLTRPPFNVPADLAAICHRCLEKAPADRYQTLTDLAEDLERFLDGRRIKGSTRIVRFARGAKRGWRSKVVVLSALAAALLVGGLKWRRDVHEKAAAELARNVAQQKRELDYLTAAQEAFANLDACNMPAVDAFLARFAPAMDLHGVEWRLLDRAARQAVWSVHTDAPEVHSAAIDSGPGGAVYCGLRDGRIQVRAKTNGALLATLRGHKGPVNWMTLLDDGKTLATCGEDGFVRTWDIKKATLVHAFKAHDDWIAVGRLTPDGRRLVTCGGDGKIRFWRLPGFAADGLLVGHSDSVRDVSISDDGKYLVSCSEDRRQLLWDLRTGSSVANLPPCRGGSFPETRWARHIHFLPGGPPYRAACSFFGGELVVYRFTSAGDVVIEREANSLVQRSALRASDQHLFMTRSDGSVVAVDLRSPSLESAVIGRGHGGRVFAISLDAAGTLLATGDRKGELRLWDLGKDPFGWSRLNIDGRAGFLDDEHVYLAEPHGRLAVLRAGDGSPAYSIEPRPGDEGSPMVLGGSLWRRNYGRWQGVGHGAEAPRTFAPAYPFDPAATDGGRHVPFWDAEAHRIVVMSPDLGDPTAVVEDIGQRPGSLQASSDRRYLAGEFDRRLRLFRLASVVAEVDLSGEEGIAEFVHCAFSPSGDHLALVKDDRTVSILSSDNGARVAMVCARRPLRAAVVTANLERILAVDDQGRLNIWDGRHGTFIGALGLGPDVSDARLELSPNGRRLLILLAVGGRPYNQVRVLDVAGPGG